MTTTSRTRAILEARWQAATIRPERFAGEAGVSVGNGKAYRRIAETVEDLAAVVHGEHVSEGLDELTERVWQFVHDEVLAFAEELEHGRAGRASAA